VFDTFNPLVKLDGGRDRVFGFLLAGHHETFAGELQGGLEGFVLVELGTQGGGVMEVVFDG
jgi:hypothetical protein